MPETIIRAATTADTAPLAELLRSLNWFKSINAESPAATLERVSRHLQLCLADSSHSIYVAEIAPNTLTSTLIGYGAVHWLPYLFLTGPEGFLSELFVDPAYRGQGVGTRLLEAVTTEAKQRGCARLMLVNDRDRESYLRQFYAKQGWTERATMANFVYRF